MNLIYISRGGLIDTADGAQLALHIWIGPLGLHVFRRPLGVEWDWCSRWREPVV